MTTICPNCLRLVRNGASYCGFCGAELNPTGTANKAAVLTVQPVSEVENEIVNESGETKVKPKSKGSRARRVVLIVIIVLLFIVMLAAFLVRYWPAVSQYLIPTIRFLLQR